MPTPNTINKAKAAWSRTGRPVNTVDRMEDHEVEELAALTLDDFTAVEGFREKIDDFYNRYLEARKAVDEEAEEPTEVETED